MRSRVAQVVVGVLLALLLFRQFVLVPLGERHAAASREVTEVRERLAAAQVLRDLKAQLDPLLVASASTDKLLTRVERRFQQAGVRRRVRQMRDLPVKEEPDGSRRVREAAFLRVDNLDMHELEKVLKELDRLERDVWVRKLDLRIDREERGVLVLEIEELETE